MGSVLGSILDPAADKALMTTLVVTLTVRGLVPCTFPTTSENPQPSIDLFNLSTPWHHHLGKGRVVKPVCFLDTMENLASACESCTVGLTQGVLD